jgi:hypothetical protein
MSQAISIEDIQKDKEAKFEILRQLYRGFQDEMEQIEEEQQRILLDMIKFRQNHEQS